MKPAALLPVLLLAACGGGGPEAPAKPPCDLSVDALAGKSFVWLEEAIGKPPAPNHMARMQFREENGKIHVKYNVKSGLAMYDYACEPGKREGTLSCRSTPDIQRACLALEVIAEGACTVENLAKAGFTADPEEVAKHAEANRKLVAEAKRSSQWNEFRLMANNLGNKLQGLLDVSVDTEACHLDVKDKYATLVDGARVVELNPLAEATFVPTTDELLWEDCTTEALVDLFEPVLPKNLNEIPPDRTHEPGKEVHYLYLGEPMKAQEGCTYSADTWGDGKPIAKDVPIEVENGIVAWQGKHVWSAEGRSYFGTREGVPVHGHYFHMVRYETCGGTKKQIDVICNAARVGDGPVATAE